MGEEISRAEESKLSRAEENKRKRAYWNSHIERWQEKRKGVNSTFDPGSNYGKE